MVVTKEILLISWVKQLGRPFRPQLLEENPLVWRSVFGFSIGLFRIFSCLWIGSIIGMQHFDLAEIAFPIFHLRLQTHGFLAIRTGNISPSFRLRRSESPLSRLFLLGRGDHDVWRHPGVFLRLVLRWYRRWFLSPAEILLSKSFTRGFVLFWYGLGETLGIFGRFGPVNGGWWLWRGRGRFDQVWVLFRDDPAVFGF